MKLYTEEQVREMIEKSRETGLTADYLILTNKGIELPSDEEIHIHATDYSSNYYEFRAGAKWLKNKIQEDNK